MITSTGRKRVVDIDTNRVMLVFYNFGCNEDLRWRATCLAEEMGMSLPPGRYRIEDLIFNHSEPIWRRRRLSFEVTNI